MVLHLVYPSTPNCFFCFLCHSFFFIKVDHLSNYKFFFLYHCDENAAIDLTKYFITIRLCFITDMGGKNSYIQHKTIVGYLLLIIYIAVTGYIIYSSTIYFSTTETSKSRNLGFGQRFVLKCTKQKVNFDFNSFNSSKIIKDYINQVTKLNIDTLKTLF
jgi:hypothetical protein